MRGRTARQYRNYGELLYMEGLTKKENQMKLIKQKQSDDEARELAQLTLMPEIRCLNSLELNCWYLCVQSPVQSSRVCFTFVSRSMMSVADEVHTWLVKQASQEHKAGAGPGLEKAAMPREAKAGSTAGTSE